MKDIDNQTEQKNQSNPQRAALIKSRLHYMLIILLIQAVIDIGARFFLDDSALSDDMGFFIAMGGLVVILMLAVTYIVFTVKLSGMFNNIFVTIILGILAFIFYLNFIPFLVLFIQAKKEFDAAGEKLKLF